MTNPLELDTQRPLRLIRLCPPYQPTPIRELASPNGCRILIKDETSRLNLGAFKALGGIYAIAAYLLDQWRTETGEQLDPVRLFDEDIQDWSSQVTFVCASAGNHGMAVARGSQLFNTKCRVHLADSVPGSFAERLSELGAEVRRSGATYEDSMNAAIHDCENGEVLLSDSSWPGYTKMPALVMEGYTVMAEEMRETFEATRDWPSHVFLQAGVGGMAAAVAYHIRQSWAQQPEIIVVEPEAAPCLFESHRLGSLTSVTGPVSAMGRLDCKEPSLLAFEILQRLANRFVLVSEAEAESATSFLATNGIATTPSGAAGMAAILFAERLDLPLANDAFCLAIATEGKL